MAQRWLFGLAAVALVTVVASCRSEKQQVLDPAVTTPVTTPATPEVTERSDPRSLRDEEIKAALVRELAADGISYPNLRTEVEVGIVRLTGQVPHLLAKERTARIAGTIRGVRSVIDSVEVAPTRRSDAEIAKDIRAALLADPAADSYQVQVSVNGGVATLSGSVDSWQEKQLAASLAKSVTGVTEIKNAVELEYETVRPDHEIRADVESRLEWDVLVDHQLIDVMVEEGVVKLAGTVGSVAEKNRAAADAWVVGARTVDVSDVDVDWWLADQHRRKAEFVPRSDDAIRQAIDDATLLDPRVKSYQIDATVTGGAVTLTGQVANLRAKRAAERIAERTTGVVSVVNAIELSPAARASDAEIERELNTALAFNPITASYEIAVDAKDGAVTLTGRVDSYFEKAEATSLAMRIDGVTSVDNRLEVARPGTAFVYEPYELFDFPDLETWSGYIPPATGESDAEIKTKVTQELLWDPDVDHYQVEVTVRDGEATLSGVVDSRFESLQAELNAFQGGAVKVDNQLVVRRR